MCIRDRDFVLTEGRSTVVADIKTLSQRILNSYDAGLHIVTVVLQDAQPPEEVQDAFADAIKAREDEQRLKNEAEAYSNEAVSYTHLPNGGSAYSSPRYTTDSAGTRST